MLAPAPPPRSDSRIAFADRVRGVRSLWGIFWHGHGCEYDCSGKHRVMLPELDGKWEKRAHTRQIFMQSMEGSEIH